MTLDQMSVLSPRVLRSLGTFLDRISSRYDPRTPCAVYLDGSGDLVALELLGPPVSFISRSHYLAELLAPRSSLVRCSLGSLVERVRSFPVAPPPAGGRAEAAEPERRPPLC